MYYRTNINLMLLLVKYTLAVHENQYVRPLLDTVGFDC